MKRKGNLTAASDVVTRVLDKERSDPRRAAGANALRVFASFERIGPPIVDHADPVFFRRGVLTLQVGESGWLTELSFLAPKIRSRMNAILGRDMIKEVRLRLGPLLPRPPPPPRPRPVSQKDRDRIAKWAEGIGDDAVREAVVRAAERFAAMPPKKYVDVSGPPGPRPTPQQLVTDEKDTSMSYGYGDKPRDRWKGKKPRW